MTITKQELALLFRFYQRSQQFTGGGIYGDSIMEHISFADEMRASLLLGRLKGAGFVDKRGTGSQNRSVFSVTDEGEKYIEGLMESDPAALDAAVALLAGDHTNNLPTPVSGEVEEQEPDWSPLPIEKSEPEYTEAVAALDAAIQSIQGDNGYAVTYPVERAEVLSRMSAGLSLLKDAPAYSASAIQVYIVWPLQKLALRFTPETLIGVAMKFAWDTFTAWVKKRGGTVLDEIFK